MHIRSLKNIFRKSSWKALTKDLIQWNNPLRVVRWYVLRVVHPFNYLRRRRMVPIVSADRRNFIQALQNEGSGIAKQDLDPTLLSEVCSTLRMRADQMQIHSGTDGKGKNFWKDLLQEKDYHSDSPFVRLALQPAVLETMSQYMGEVPYLAYIHVALSHPTSNEAWKASQLWHEDYDDRKMLKLFVYCTDVAGEEDGAFTYIPKHVSKHVPNTIFPGRIADDVMARHVKDEDIHRIIGPAESAFYIDTRNCYHLGSRIAQGHRRIAFMASFVSNASLQPFQNGITITHEPTAMERLVLLHA